MFANALRRSPREMETSPPLRCASVQGTRGIAVSPGKKAFGISILLHTALLTGAYFGVNQLPLRTLRTEGRSEWMVTLRAPQTQPRRKTATPKIVLTDTLSTHRSSAISNFSTVPTSAGSLALTSYLAEIRAESKPDSLLFREVMRRGNGARSPFA